MKSQVKKRKNKPVAEYLPKTKSSYGIKWRLVLKKKSPLKSRKIKGHQLFKIAQVRLVILVFFVFFSKICFISKGRYTFVVL